MPLSDIAAQRVAKQASDKMSADISAKADAAKVNLPFAANEDRNTSRVAAAKRGGDYMENVGKEGIKRQQEGMARTATSVEDARAKRQAKFNGKYPQ